MVVSALLPATLLVAGSLSCSKEAPTLGCDLCTTSAVVRGTVRDTLGAPAGGVQVALDLLADSCSGTPLDRERVLTDPAGRYRVAWRTPYAPFGACVAARAFVLPDSLLAADTVERKSPLPFRDDYPPGGPHDSLNLDLVLWRHVVVGPPLGTGQPVRTNALVRYVAMEGGCWALDTPWGRYEPVNLSAPYRVDGLPVFVVMRGVTDMATVCMMANLASLDSISAR